MKTTLLALAVIAAILLPCVVARGQDQRLMRDGHSLSEWIERTKDPKPEVRKQAAIVLHDMGPDAKAAVPALTRLLSDKESGVRDRAARALAVMGPQAKTAVPALIKLLDDSVWYVRQSALKRWAE